MPDISMCEGGDCPQKEKCYRHMAIPTPHWQAYFTEQPFDRQTGECEHFWQIEPGRKIRPVSDEKRDLLADGDEPGRRIRKLPELPEKK